MAYDPASLSPNDPTGDIWALTWARKLSGDKNTPERYTDEEWTAELEVDTLTVTHDVAGVETETVYYRPHRTAARVIAADPDWATSESLLGGSVTRRSAASVAGSVRRAGSWIDSLISDLVDELDNVTETSEAAPLTLKPGF